MWPTNCGPQRAAAGAAMRCQLRALPGPWFPTHWWRLFPSFVLLCQLASFVRLTVGMCAWVCSWLIALPLNEDNSRINWHHHRPCVCPKRKGKKKLPKSGCPSPTQQQTCPMGDDGQWSVKPRALGLTAVATLQLPAAALSIHIHSHVINYAANGGHRRRNRH